MMSNYPLFSVLGIEIEYMLVDKETLTVQPQCDILLKDLAGQQVNEVELGEITLSNELVMHVLELKNNGPKPPNAPIAEHFHQAILQLQPLLQKYNLCLLPTGAHPWMDTSQETRRWPYGNKAIYNQYNTIFNCEGHGWANLQSMHVNLPFSNDEEFCQLHNSIRLLLPLLPALAASTPILDGKATGYLDSRLVHYEKNQDRIPAISGQVIPEFICSQTQYEKEILATMYKDISPYDPEGLLQYEWLNSRAAIAKFEMMAIEIRILDSQECVNADIAIAQAIQAILQGWNNASSAHLEEPYDTKKLKHLYDQAIAKGLSARVDDPVLLRQWQLPSHAITLRDAWALLLERIGPELNPTSQLALEFILEQGNLSERILKTVGNNYQKQNLLSIYRQLGECLLANQQFGAL